MPPKRYYLIEHPKQPDVQLVSDDGILLLFSSKDLAEENRSRTEKAELSAMGPWLI